MSFDRTIHHSHLDEHPRNYREHPEDQLVHITQSLREHGFYKNIVVSSDDYILAGHGVAKATRELEGSLDERVEELHDEGKDEQAELVSLVNDGNLPIVQIPHEHDSPQALKVLAGDNEIGEVGMKNDSGLAEILEDIASASETALDGTGFDDQRLSALEMVASTPDEVADEDDEDPDFDYEEHWKGMPEYDEEPDTRYKLNISFRSIEDREQFILACEELLNHVEPKEKRTMSAWWPPKADNDRHSLRFEPEQ